METKSANEQKRVREGERKSRSKKVRAFINMNITIKLAWYIFPPSCAPLTLARSFSLVPEFERFYPYTPLFAFIQNAINVSTLKHLFA